MILIPATVPSGTLLSLPTQRLKRLVLQIVQVITEILWRGNVMEAIPRIIKRVCHGFLHISQTTNNICSSRLISLLASRQVLFINFITLCIKQVEENDNLY